MPTADKLVQTRPLCPLTITRIQWAVLRLFDRLARDALQPAMKKGYVKIKTWPILIHSGWPTSS